MIELDWLPPDERAKFYRTLNGRALRDAERSRGTLRLAFLHMAQQWQHLANATEGTCCEHVTSPPEEFGLPKGGPVFIDRGGSRFEHLS